MLMLHLLNLQTIVQNLLKKCVSQRDYEIDFKVIKSKFIEHANPQFSVYLSHIRLCSSITVKKIYAMNWRKKLTY